MRILTLLSISLVILFEVHAKKLDSGTNAIHGSTSESPSVSASSSSKTSQETSQTKKKRYATREVILYLTPSQIKALEAGEGLISLQSLPDVGQEQLTNQDLKLQEQTEFVKQEFENLKSASIQPVEHPDEEHLKLASQEPILQKELLSAVNQQDLDEQWVQELANREEQLKLHNYYHELRKAEQLKLHQEANAERNAWFPNNPNIQLREGYGIQEPIQHEHIVDTNQFQLKAFSPLPLYDPNSESLISHFAKPLLPFQHSPKYSDQEKAIEIEHVLRARYHHELEKQNALSQAENFANTPAILVQEQVKISKEHAVPVDKHVKVPVPTPVWVSIPEPIPVRIPHPYPVHQHIPVPIEQKDRIALERPVPYNLENRISSPFTKVLILNIGTPYVDQKIVPVAIKSLS